MGIIDLSNDTRLTNWYGWAYQGREPVVENCEILRPDVTIVKEWITIDTTVKQ